MDLAKSRHQKGFWTKILQISNETFRRFQSIQIDMKNMVYTDKKFKLKHFCGGAILNQHQILTAAHCFFAYTGTKTE